MTIIKILFITTIFLLHIFIYFTLFRNLSLEPLIRHASKIFLIVNFSFVVLYFLVYRSHLDSKIYIVLSSSIGIFWVLTCTSLILLFIMFFVKIGFGLLVFHKYIHMIAFLTLICSLVIIVFSFYQNRKLNFPVEKINISNLQNNLKVALIADLHIDILMNEKEVQKIVTATNSHQPDIIILAGDIVDSPFIDKNNVVKNAMLELQKLNAKYGIYYSLGNHEYFYDYKELVKFLKDSNIKVLQNENIFLDDIKLNIAGINDISTLRYKNNVEKSDILKALDGINEAYPTVLISHQPKTINLLNKKEYKKIDLVLSGHTHGGQLFPFNFLVYLDQPFLKGLHKFQILDKQSLIFVTQGAGWWAMPMRLFSTREVNILDLESR